MARYRLSGPAQADISQILARSAAVWGLEGRRRYSSLLAAAFRQAANDPKGATSRDQSHLLPGLRSIHLRHVKGEETDAKVNHPVHMIFYRTISPELVEIIRILHERMEPKHYFRSQDEG
jgi:toxin ParE1/3/4